MEKNRRENDLYIEVTYIKPSCLFKGEGVMSIEQEHMARRYYKEAGRVVHAGMDNKNIDKIDMFDYTDTYRRINGTDRKQILECIRMIERQADINSVQDILNCAHMGIALYKYLSDRDIFKFDIWSQGAAEITGYNIEEVNGEHLKASPDMIEGHRQAFKSLREELRQNPGIILTQEKDFNTPYGKRKTVSMTSTGIHRGEDFYILSLLKDITTEREMERRIKESEKRFKDFFELSPEASFIFTVSKILLVNNAAVQLLGYSSKEALIGLNILDIVHHKCKKNAQVRLQQNEFTIGELYNTKLITNDGHVIDAEVALAVLDYEGQKAVHASIRNVTKRMEFERKLKKSEEGYRKIVNLLPDPVYIFDGKKIIYGNASYIRFMKAKDERELIGKNHCQLLYLDDERIHQLNEILEEVSRTENIGVWEGMLQRRRDDEYIYISASIIKIPNASVKEFMIIVKDLEDLRRNEEMKLRYAENRRQLEETLEYDKQRTEFFCNLSHELRTPINVILGAAQMSSITMNGYEQLKEDGKLFRYVDIIKQNCLRLIRMTNNLIDITRIDFGYFNMKYVKDDIVSAIEKITTSVSEYVQNKGLQLIFDTDTEERIIAFDYEKLERILLNLLSNAVKFTEAGGCIYVNVKNTSTHVSISVRDTGIGIPEDMQEKIFQRFMRVDESLSRNAEGSGIGLSIVKSLVRMHNGEIALKSSPGEGSEFTISLPCSLQEDKEPAQNIITKNEECLEKVKVEFSDIYY